MPAEQRGSIYPLEAAGVGRRRIYDLWHTAISTWLAASLGVFEVSHYAGTSVAMIDRVYGHLLVDAEVAAAQRLDVWATSGPRPTTTSHDAEGANPHG